MYPFLFRIFCDLDHSDPIKITPENSFAPQAISKYPTVHHWDAPIREPFDN